VCTYKLPKEFDEISIGYSFTPGQDAVVASRERCNRVKDGSLWWKPLIRISYAGGGQLDRIVRRRHGYQNRHHGFAAGGSLFA
ncbi:MAG: hypothetical protein K8T89_10250, partial [Planctomycetes bacterium]|nr:hypothetical protein [Planctomycetota bacterium]